VGFTPTSPPRAANRATSPAATCFFVFNVRTGDGHSEATGPSDRAVGSGHRATAHPGEHVPARIPRLPAFLRLALLLRLKGGVASEIDDRPPPAWHNPTMRYPQGGGMSHAERQRRHTIRLRASLPDQGQAQTVCRPELVEPLPQPS
jgi:hypothetical protein